MPSPAGRRHPRKKRRRSGWWGQGEPGPRREFLRISHMRRGASDSPEGKTQRLERSCLRRSLRLWHRRVALRAVGLEGKRGRKKESHSEILASSNINVRLMVWGTGILAAPRSQSQCWGKAAAS